MAFTLTMPEVGETVTEGTIEKWLKQPGEKVEKYESIVEINTDKVNVELPSPVSGTMVEHLVKEGDTVPIGTALATIDEIAGETPADIAPPKPVAEPVPVAAAASAPHASKRDANGARGEPNRATPRVRRAAAELGVDLASVSGTGPGGRVVEADVRAAASRGATAVAKRPLDAPAKPKPIVAGLEEETVALTGIRKTIAQRMSQSAFSAPHAWLVVESDVTKLVALRNEKKAAFQQRHRVDLTYLPFMAHAVAQTLLDHPYLNASWGEDKIILRKRVHLGIAVATERGLLVPVIRDADRLSVTGLALAMSELGEKTRDNKLALEDVQGGTFTLDNTGAFGSIISMPIINLGQSAILSMETITKRPVVVEGDAIAVRSMVNTCLSFDHRVLDGHLAGAFLRDVKARLEAYGPDTGID